MNSESSRVIIVSGGSRGLGQGIVEHLLNAGETVVTFSRSKTNFITTLENKFDQHKFYWEAIDGTDFKKLTEFVQKIFKQYGRIDGLINNAGIAKDSLLTLTKAEDIASVLLLNLEACIRLSQMCIKYMLINKSGIIINISSIIGSRGYSGLSVYSASKAGLDGFTRSLARELGEKNIRVNSIAPGYLNTEMTHSLSESQKQQIIRRTPLGRLGEVNDIVGVIQFLLSPQAKFITGQTIIVDGGITC